ncbi:MAG: acetolactate synthase small subunit [Succinivibrionaceae bacterium]|nr:acetolactate synthase small subunit [Ruminobacter sp.]MDY5779275.1 acetolactate synthase small subunit [Succinivibrionaceae bacterium]MEE1340354.1 acetolactate synthase small subunit [Succinivibrionaceae bacterium]
MRHILSILLENEAGALSRVVGLFSQRGFNIESLTVAPTEDATLSRMTIVTFCDADEVEQITKQLHKLIDVLKVCDLADSGHVEREIMLIKVRANSRDLRDEIKSMADIFHGNIVDLTPELYTVQIIGTSEDLNNFLVAVREVVEIVEVIRSGVCGISRGERSLRP